MKPFRNILLVLSLCFLQVDGEYKRICYFTNWSQYRPQAATFFPEDIDPHLCNHIIFTYADLVGNQLTAFEWNDEISSAGPGLYARTVALKESNPNLKVSLSVGGSSFEIVKITLMLRNESNRQQFAQNAIAFLRARGFDGLDLDFQYPGSGASHPLDKFRFTLLLQELRRAFEEEANETGKERLILTSAVSAIFEIIENAYEIDKISEALDYVNLIAYDLQGPWTGSTSFHSPLYSKFDDAGPNSTRNVDWAVNHWLSNGCPQHKLILSLNTYGRGYTLEDKNNLDVGAPTKGPSKVGAFTREEGFYSYYEICDLLMTGKGMRYWSAEQCMPYLVSEDQWISYEDQYSLAVKVNYIKSKGIAGVSIWSFDLDDFKGQFCFRNPYPLFEIIMNDLGEGSPTSTPSQQTTSSTVATTQATSEPTTAKSTTAESTTTTESAVTTIYDITTSATQTTTVTTPSTTKSPEQIARDTCDANGEGTWPYPNDNTKYIWCFGTAAYIRYCPVGTTFDPIVLACVAP